MRQQQRRPANSRSGTRAQTATRAKVRGPHESACTCVGAPVARAAPAEHRCKLTGTRCAPDDNHVVYAPRLEARIRVTFTRTFFCMSSSSASLFGVAVIGFALYRRD
ncbi:hypothetical protein MTO96_005834 [Rhipicephalus appendiculatus]